jgi:threonine dehydrogenase-like Zn-dependent dehydrogenase
MKTRAIIFPERGRAVIDDVPLPDIGVDDVLIEIEYTAVSPGTERWCLTGNLSIPGEAPLAFPHVPGYQAAGVLREVGRGVKDLKPGDRAFSRNCRSPDGFKGSWWGGHVAMHVAASSAVIALPESVFNREASGLLLAQVGYNGASKPPVRAGDTAVVIGEGLVGQYAAQVLRHRGAHVIVSGLVPDRLAAAALHSADEVFDASGGAGASRGTGAGAGAGTGASGDLAAFVRGRFPQGVAIAVDTASSARTVRLCADLLAYGGHLVMNGFYPATESTLDWHWLRGKELTLHCPNSRTRARLEATLALISAGAMKVEELVTHEFALSQAPRAYEMLLDPAAPSLGMVIRWKE